MSEQLVRLFREIGYGTESTENEAYPLALRLAKREGKQVELAQQIGLGTLVYITPLRRQGITSFALEDFRKNIGRIGNLIYILGRESRKGIWVYFVGNKGTISISGFNWGYGGEGPTGLYKALQLLGLGDSIARNLAFNTEVGRTWIYFPEPSMF